ncbi:hypothetical protein F4823DRAFT_564507 [Ustulina deusta]|nr:hypothetical protein F4823DRAFT_564507 [Ustulina deusta]
MPVAQNAVIAILLAFLVVGIGALVWKGKKIVEHFARSMFTAKQAQQEQPEQEEQQQEPPQHRRRAEKLRSAKESKESVISQNPRLSRTKVRRLERPSITRRKCLIYGFWPVQQSLGRTCRFSTLHWRHGRTGKAGQFRADLRFPSFFTLEFFLESAPGSHLRRQTQDATDLQLN